MRDGAGAIGRSATSHVIDAGSGARGRAGVAGSDVTAGAGGVGAFVAVDDAMGGAVSIALDVGGVRAVVLGTADVAAGVAVPQATSAPRTSAAQRGIGRLAMTVAARLRVERMSIQVAPCGPRPKEQRIQRGVIL